MPKSNPTPRESGPLAVGSRVEITLGHSRGERGTITNSPGEVFTGWTVKLDNGRIFGVGAWEMKGVDRDA